ncbi:MAG TPA: helix-hairpin-helix domain-containing protein [Candidatus Saccharimonadales bacterium]|nr:helix-hairpin-helix domain-containing protein [Candidatus Saccharimonadales bacterium]
MTNKLLCMGARRLAIAVAGALVLIGAAGWLAVHQNTVQAPVPAGATVDPPAPSTVLVFVSGAVEHAGLYELSPDARVADALAAAGGITTLADPGHLPNMAERVHDGRQINVPFLRSGTTAAKLDINSAAPDELDAIPGMPIGLGRAIVAYRDEWGPFTSMSQLHGDLGVDAATVTGLEHYLRVVLPAQ